MCLFFCLFCLLIYSYGMTHNISFSSSRHSHLHILFNTILISVQPGGSSGRALCGRRSAQAPPKCQPLHRAHIQSLGPAQNDDDLPELTWVVVLDLRMESSKDKLEAAEWTHFPLLMGAPRNVALEMCSSIMETLERKYCRFVPLSRLSRGAEQADDTDWISLTLLTLQLHCPAQIESTGLGLNTDQRKVHRDALEASGVPASPESRPRPDFSARHCAAKLPSHLLLTIEYC